MRDKIMALSLSIGVLAPFALGACAPKVPQWPEQLNFSSKTEMPTECAGWQKIEIKNRTRYDLMRVDQRLLVDVDAHNLRGRNLGCWQ